MTSHDERWHFAIDVGGTFTDYLAHAPSGEIVRGKVLSSAVVKRRIAQGSSVSQLVLEASQRLPSDFWRGYEIRLLGDADAAASRGCIASSSEHLSLGSPLRQAPAVGQVVELVSPEESPLLAIRLTLGLRLDEPIPPCVVHLGTTRGTNALLTRRGAPVGLVATRGNGDMLKIGYQERPKLFALDIQKPAPLFEQVAEIDERVAADGSVLLAPTVEQIKQSLTQLRKQGAESLAICLLNSYANPAHELIVEQCARELGFQEISVSHRVSPLMKIVPRGDTTVIDAYLNPLLRRYVGQLERSLVGSELRLMTSAGGLLSPAVYTGKDSVLSGPAGGVVGFSRVAQAAGYKRAIGFDMGGTSTDVSRFDGRFEYEFETQKAGVRIVTPMLAIETVAAGGGSVCQFDGVKLTVGPASAGADPGPACYGRGGPLTVTDCNLMLGRLLPQHFPLPLDRAAVEQRLEEIAQAIVAAPGATDNKLLTPLELAAGFLRIANANMAAAIRTVSIAKGYDAREYALVPFGAAGPQHACAIARELGMRTIISHADAGILSAVGIGEADVVRHRATAIYRPLTDVLPTLGEMYESLAAAAVADVLGEGIAQSQIAIHRSLELRYQGIDAALSIDEPADGDYRAAFARRHRQRYGYEHNDRPLEVVSARVEAVGRRLSTLATASASSEALPCGARLNGLQQSPEIAGTQRLWVDGDFRDVPVYDRGALQTGSEVAGPAIVVEPLTTTVIDVGWSAAVASGGELILTNATALRRDAALVDNTQAAVVAADPVLLELFNNHFTAIATQMGSTLRNTASSVNVKERLDFSCAIFTTEGDLVVNAPHIPVHLGAMSETVKRVIADNPNLAAGDVFVANDPYRGGSHLPDVTVVTPVFANGPAPILFTASRAHHAEIGGITPGSMPPFSRNLAEEGVLIRNFQLVAGGQSRLDELRQLLLSGPFPSRAVEHNLADITAQMAANRQGASDLQRLIERHSLPVVTAYMQHIQVAAEQKMRGALLRLAPGRRTFVDHLDDGTPIAVAIDIAGDSATIDFTGTGAVLAGNLNANRAIVTAAILYCLRLLIGEEIPLNQGVLAPIKTVLPECLLNPPERARAEDCAAVVGGNVETSQRVVDVLLGALGLAAASQGTMNNLLFGDERFGYYETICGGSGATANAAGADAVQTHMTNTRLTDPEVLESRFPVRLVEFAIRRGSGGAGVHRGGDGVRRRIEFLRPLRVSLLTQRRGPYPPYGVSGGEPGKLGGNSLKRADGTLIDLAAHVQIDVQPGDVLTVETPGGGGFGTMNYE